MLFRTLEEFYNASFGWATLPLMLWRFATIGIGSLLTGMVLGSLLLHTPHIELAT